MFTTSRSDGFHETLWSCGPDQIRQFEAFKFSSASSDVSRSSFLEDDDIAEWVEQKEPYLPPSPDGRNVKLEGGIRLLFCERLYYRPPSFPVSWESYGKIEEAFHLAPSTLYSFLNDGGSYSRYMEYDEEEPQKLKRICIVIKATQKYQIANYGLVYSYDFETKLSTGIVHGTGVVSQTKDYAMWKDSPSTKLMRMIEAVPHLWTQPMLLSSILLQHYITRAERFCYTTVDDNILNTQYQLGISRAGRLYTTPIQQDPVSGQAIQEKRFNLRHLTSEMSTNMTEVVNLGTVAIWASNCVSFLGKTLDEVTRGVDSKTREENRAQVREIKECLEYLTTASEGLKTYHERCQAIIQTDFSVLYSVISQLDNRLNAKMAASSSRDSTAMKTLAFITTLFLPASTVAAVFSMSMFNWQTSSDSKESTSEILSSYFWIYWVVTIPLTILVGIIWRFWWTYEKRKFDDDVRLEIEIAEDPAYLNEFTEKPNVQRKNILSISPLGKGLQAVRRRLRKEQQIGEDAPSGSQ